MYRPNSRLKTLQSEVNLRHSQGKYLRPVDHTQLAVWPGRQFYIKVPTFRLPRLLKFLEFRPFWPRGVVDLHCLRFEGQSLLRLRFLNS
ncbi:hypothetical protein RRG08_062499 [Elysia crispata]|uniref:Uncharacterized protein n=1 Tax=Elysia crispata TaxID=231223 RepID=A0AAE0ZXE8_9GAST|nr:hypothetical protein RRG08_062499 [Elysia crispata]